MTIFLAILIFFITLLFVIWQPKGLSIGWSALGGAALVLLLQIVSLEDVWAVVRITWNATLTFVALIIISLVLDKIGFFEWAALHMAKFAGGHGKRMFLALILLGAVIAGLFANDGASLILTPIVLAIVRTLDFDDKQIFPFIIASGFIADTTSMPLVVSNLVNILSADFFHISFSSYVVQMLLPTLFSFLASTLVLYLYFRKALPKTYALAQVKVPAEAIQDRRLFKISWYLLAILLVGYWVAPIFKLPISVIALPAAGILLYASKKSHWIKAKQVLKEAPWNIVFFSVGMYVVVYGLQNAGITKLLAQIIQTASSHGLFASILSMGFLSAFLSSIMNNMPAVMIHALAIDQVHVHTTIHSALIYANIIGADIGPKITPIGSLATLIWLHLLNKKGIQISWLRYMKIGIILTVPVLFVTLVGLYVSVVWLH